MPLGIAIISATADDRDDENKNDEKRFHDRTSTEIRGWIGGIARSSRLRASKNPGIAFGQFFAIRVAHPVEFLEPFRLFDPVSDQVIRHDSAGLFGKETDDLELPVFLVFEHRSDDPGIQ